MWTLWRSEKNLLSPAGIRTPRLAIIIIVVIIIIIIIIILSVCLSVLQQARSLFQNEFSTECYLVLPLSISSILCFP
jgi:hypothetical protein